MFVELHTNDGTVIVNTDFIVSFERHPAKGTIITLSTLSYSKGHLVVNDDFENLKRLVTKSIVSQNINSVPETENKTVPISIRT